MYSFFLKPLIIFLVLSAVNPFGYHTQNHANKSYTYGRKSYKIDLEKSLKILMNGKSLDIKTVDYLIPRTQKEWREYYSFTEKGAGFNKAFYQLDKLIGKYASINSLKTLKLYLEMSPFVDGEYAEGYFDDADFIIGKQKKEFCRIYPDLSKKVRALFDETYKNYCK